ncbi:cytochrome c maturation protein CcmE [Roseomonas indoligenes]|uniref:Cytochrome c-type biogenesis protein CcmE n=1 Tax=Roseomonas indoligenes TaxID=2820811 RepID=A0A940MR45_9PROT|nr:cytochrome c maturation protein CcmE [Pararoseomonas indoligenes]MBP0491944.1 cytochrome c maturation protein CcmE [Pararoseomonas indoligenes]
MSGAAAVRGAKPGGLGRAAARRRRRLWVLLLCGLGLGMAAALALTAFQDNLVFFRSPSDIAAGMGHDGRAFRLGGLVEAGSVVRDGTEARFRVTDGPHAIAVTYRGVLPDLFREGQGVVTLGKMLPDGSFAASEVLARHDETYMPPEVKDALERSGHWNPSQGAAPPPSGWNTMQPAPAGARTGG